MKIPIAFYLLSVVLIVSCGQEPEEDSFEKRMEESRKSVADIDFAVSSYTVDSSKFWRVTSENKGISKSNKWSTVIINDFRQNNNSVGEVKKEFEGKVDLLGQKIFTDSANKISMCYLTRDEQGASSIFRVTFVTNDKSEITEIDSTDSGEWEKIKSAINSKKND